MKFSESQTADILGIQYATLVAWRRAHRGPGCTTKAVRGKMRIFYGYHTLREWIDKKHANNEAEHRNRVARIEAAREEALDG